MLIKTFRYISKPPVGISLGLFGIIWSCCFLPLVQQDFLRQMVLVIFSLSSGVFIASTFVCLWEYIEKMQNVKNITCFVELNGELRYVEVTSDGDDVTCWLSGDYDDTVGTMDEFLETYGDTYFESLNDFKQDKEKKFGDFFAHPS